ncbi:MAG: ROK family protein [Peptococcaceae bacterium]|nr:ROK family protein [Peptococcaceae bacterium]
MPALRQDKYKFVAGVDLGGTKIHTALADSRGGIVAEVRVPTGDHGPARIVAAIGRTVNEVGRMADVAVADIGALGIGAPGPLDIVRGVVHQSPNLGWYDVPLKEMLEQEVGIPVAVDNDGNVAALGELRHGAGRGNAHLLYVAVGTGIGCGLIFDGRVYRGAGYGAGEIGHMTLDPDGPRCACGNRGCLEALASGPAIARAARERAKKGGARAIVAAAGSCEAVTAETVAGVARAGDAEARAILAAAGRGLGTGIAAAVNLLHPAMAVVGGGVMQAGPLLWEPMEQEFRRRTLNC